MSALDKRNTNWSWIVIIVLILGSVWSVYSPFQLDLSKQKKYSLHPNTKKILKAIEKPIHVKIYLAGELPIELRKLQKAIQYFLRDAKKYHPQLSLELIDLDTYPPDQKQKVLQKLLKKGLEIQPYYLKKKGKYEERWTYPMLLLCTEEKEIPITLLQKQQNVSTTELVTNTIEDLEYLMMEAIITLSEKRIKKIVILHDEIIFTQSQYRSMLGHLQINYDLYALPTLNKQMLKEVNPDALLLIISKKVFSETEKYALDQYIMQGGKVLCFIDPVWVSKSDLQSGKSLAMATNQNLDDLFFKYGVKFKKELIEDLQCGVYPIITHTLQQKPQITLFPFPFKLIMNHFTEHVVTKNIGPISGEFVSSIEDLPQDDITQTALLWTSPYTRLCKPPYLIDLNNLLKQQPEVQLFHTGQFPILYLLEGCFPSLYANRPLPDSADPNHFIARSQSTQLIVSSTTSILTNQIDPKTNKIYAWGYDPFLNRKLDNNKLILNLLNYLLDEKQIMSIRSKNMHPPLLDSVKSTQKRLFWQIFNFVIPFLFLFLLGLVYNFVYRKKYQ